MRTLDQDLQIEKAAAVAADREIAILRYLEQNPELRYQANIGLFRDYLGNAQATPENLDRARTSLTLAIKSAEQVQWEADEQAALDQEAAIAREHEHQRRLRTDIEYLRKTVKQDSIRNRSQQTPSNEAERDRHNLELHGRSGFPALPANIDKQCLFACSAAELKAINRIYGESAVTARLQGRN